MYRVYDKELEEWRDDIVVFNDGALGVYTFHKLLPNTVSILFNEEPYVIHFDTGTYDKNNNVIFEGDICKDKDGNEYIVGYGREVGAYCLFDYDNDLYYILVDEVSNDVEVVGNVFDGVVNTDEDS